MSYLKILVSTLLMGLVYGVAQTAMAVESSVPATNETKVAPKEKSAPKTKAEPKTKTAPATKTSPETRAEPETQVESAAIEEQSGFSRGSVVRSIFTSAIDQREPVDQLKQLAKEQSQIFYFTELRDMAGQTARHRWQYNGEVVAEIDFDVRGPRWRVWSTKSLSPTTAGEWKVSVLNGAGEIIAEELLTIPEASNMPETISQQPASAEQQPAAPGNLQ